MENATPESLAMSPAEYIKNRVDGQIKWYEDRSSENKRWFHVMQITVIVSGTLIPLFIGYANGNLDWLKYIAGGLGTLVAILEGVMSLKKYKENWLTYRGAAENLQREKLLFLNGVGDFADEAYAFKTFVLKAEQIMSSENSTWAGFLKKKDDSSDGEKK